MKIKTGPYQPPPAGPYPNRSQVIVTAGFGVNERHPAACAFHPLTRVVEAKDYEALRERLERLTATFQIVKTYNGEHKLVVTSPNGDCYEFSAKGERARRVLRDAAAALDVKPSEPLLRGGGSEP